MATTTTSNRTGAGPGAGPGAGAGTRPDTAPGDGEAAPKRRRGRAPVAPTSTLVVFVRHGTTPTTGRVLPGRARGLHLADAGRDQAARVAERLAAWSRAGGTRKGGGAPGRIRAVYASPLERARETAEPIGRAVGLPVTADRGLIECDFGDWTGAELKKLVKLPEWAAVQRYPSGFRFPGGESFTAMQARMVEAVGELCKRHPGEAIVAVSHADPIKAVVADAVGTHLDLFQRIVISPCSVTAISYAATGPTVLTVNSIGELSAPVPS